MDEFMVGAICVMCGAGVHFAAGRVACDACDLPTDCCLCDPVLRLDNGRQPAGPTALAEPAPALALGAGTAGEEYGVVPRVDVEARRARRRRRAAIAAARKAEAREAPAPRALGTGATKKAGATKKVRKRT